MACPICEKRKAKRYCPAKAENICTLCCGMEREVTIDCPPDCAYLVESRRHEIGRREIEWSQVPFADVKIPSAFVAAHEPLVLALGYAVCLYARDSAALTDPDIVAALQSLAESYQTLSNGIYFEKPPDYILQRGLYDALKAAIENFKKTDSRNAGVVTVRDSEIRDTLIFLAQLGATRSNGRPKGRAYLDLLRSQFKSEELQKPSQSQLVLP
ncbi:MAG TPA: hypothetical protein VMW54_13555 [Terriglobia bacterium]|nr:hypothetical protein [Terriglobia bacterium]